MMLSVIVSCADTQGPPRDIPHVRRSWTDSEERRRATPNSQPTGCIDIVPREWAFGTTLAISRLGNCFAVSQRTAREVNDTRRLSKHTAEYHFVTPRIRVTESSRAVSPFLRRESLSGLSFSRNETIDPLSARLPSHCVHDEPDESAGSEMHLHASISFVAHDNDTADCRVARRVELEAGMRYENAGFRNEEVSHEHYHPHALAQRK